MVSIMYTKREQ